MITAYKFRLYPNKQQETVLGATLETCRHLYNEALAAKKEAWEDDHTNVSYVDMSKQVSANRRRNPYLSPIFAHVLNDPLKRLDKAFNNFYRRVREGAKEKGYPRFKGKDRYNSFTYPDAVRGYKIEDSKLILSKIGPIRIFKHREIEGTVKTCTIKRDGTGRWYAIFVSEILEPSKVAPRRVLGVDLGITHALTTSEGITFDYPRYYAQAEKKNRAANKSLSRKIKGSKTRRKTKVKLAQISRRVTNLREEFCHQVSRKLVDSSDLIVFENLNIAGMMKNHHLAKHIQDVSWGKLIQYTQSKAERAGKSVVLVDPRYTSQNCSKCGQIVPKELSERVHSCHHCGLILDRDHNAALNILTLGLRELARGDSASGIGIRQCKRAVAEAGSSGL